MSTVWLCPERYLDVGVAGLGRDKTRPSHVPPLRRALHLKGIVKTVKETPADPTHWSRPTTVEVMGVSPSSVGRIGSEAA